MRNIKQFVLGSVILSIILISPAIRADSEETFTGEIADSQCALNVHSLDRSHKIMIKMGSAGKNAADCSRYCVTQHSGKYVLQTKTDVYKLDNQKLAEKSAGLKVKITGVLDPKTNIIEVRTIDPIPPQ
jgi:hypothetical protein